MSGQWSVVSEWTVGRQSTATPTDLELLQRLTSADDDDDDATPSVTSSKTSSIFTPRRRRRTIN